MQILFVCVERPLAKFRTFLLAPTRFRHSLIILNLVYKIEILMSVTEDCDLLGCRARSWIRCLHFARLYPMDGGRMSLCI
jgi:hypothetical protein